MATSEQIVLLNDAGEPVGAADKLRSHHSDTPLHLAFSCYVFDGNGNFLITQRALSKKVWPGVWTNSACGHPAPGENMTDAINRRLDYELGMTAARVKLVLPKYRYKTPPYKGIIEHEECPVYAAIATSKPKPSPEEVEACQWLTWPEYIKAAESDGGNEFSWWCKDQLKLIKSHPVILEYSKAA